MKRFIAGRRSARRTQLISVGNRIARLREHIERLERRISHGPTVKPGADAELAYDEGTEQPLSDSRLLVLFDQTELVKARAELAGLELRERALAASVSDATDPAVPTAAPSRSRPTLADRVARAGAAEPRGAAPSVPVPRRRASPLRLAGRLALPRRTPPATPALPPATGGQADVLRALGAFLDEQDAASFSIVTDHDVLKVTWQTPDSAIHHRAYQEQQLEALRAKTRAMRMEAVVRPAGCNAELLRTLGQDLDAENVALLGIIRDVEGFRVSGIVGRAYVTSRYRTSEMVDRSIERQRLRGAGDRPVELGA